VKTFSWLRLRAGELRRHWFGGPLTDPDPEARYRLIDKLTGTIVTQGSTSDCERWLEGFPEAKRWRFLWQEIKYPPLPGRE
jgi:hypothetical protein